MVEKKNFTSMADQLHCRGRLIEAQHYNLMGKLPIVTVYWLKNRFKPGQRAIVARSNDWWQVR